MPASDYPIMTSALSPRKQEQFAEAIEALEAGHRKGEIPNAVYTRAKQTLSRCAEYAWQERARKPFSWNREYIEGASEEERAKLYDIDSYPQVNTLAKLTRQADALGDTAAGVAIRQLLDEARPVFDMIKICKDIAVKQGQAPKPQTATEQYQAPSASGSAMAAILAELTDITKKAREGIAQALAARHEKTVDTFLASQQAHREAVVVVGPQRFDIFNYARHLGRGRADAQLMDRLTVALDQMRGADGKKVYAWKPDGKEIITQRSAKEAEEICQSYIEKNMAKLAPIVEARGDYAGMQIVGRNVQPGSMTGQLRISFEDGARFDARSQAVMSFSQYGTPFMRYPLTFHNVKLGDGSLMSRPSEQKMNEEFTKAAVEAPAP